jgi:monoamine oxidase
MQQNPKVVVIGAGLAGLSTAHRLQQNGIDVHVYEARSRVGGRVFTALIEDSIAELGGHNIADGGEAEHIHRLIEEFGLELSCHQIQLSYSYFDSKTLISLEHSSFARPFQPDDLKSQIQKLASTSKNMRGILTGIVSEDDPLYQIIATRLSAYEGASIDKLSPAYADTLYHMLLGGISQAHLDATERQSVDLVSLKEGNAMLPHLMAKTLGDRMHLNAPLTRVSKQANGSYLLTFQDGQMTHADLLILAIPCSTFADITFDDTVIPSERLDAIKAIPYGENAKVIIPFPEITTLAKNCINDHVISFYDSHQSAIVLYYTNASSYFSDATIEHVYSQERQMMEIMYGDDCPLYTPPTYAQDASFQRYHGPIGYSWPNDPYVKGSYAYIAPGQEVSFTHIHDVDGEWVKSLFAPIDHTLYFAGEHATILSDIPGTMEAACESGERVARMVLKKIYEQK